jgi:NAD(P)-dependent dehydrogenase (short-subunit alcohol dehydrogenase family)
VDILVNNAGICKLNKVLDFGRADWDPMIDVNLTAAFELSYEAAKIMIPQKSGKIINICSLFSLSRRSMVTGLFSNQTCACRFHQSLLR